MSHFDNLGPVVTIADCAYQMGISHQALLQRLNLHQTLTRPDTFKAGGSQVMFKENAEVWIENHLEQWAALQAAKKNSQK